MKPDFIGFVFFKKSIINISFNQAEKLKSMLDDNIRSVGVFVNEDISFIEKLCRRNIIDMIQLHGNENDKYIMNLKQHEDKIFIYIMKGRFFICQKADLVFMEVSTYLKFL